jgi:wyosine [tRNA(Phe)-imidazoG37] synthetase (radical SAM superfamily)
MPWPLPLLRDIVHGPFTSSRLGISLEVNLLPANLRVCNLTCGYCHFSRTTWRNRGLVAVGRWPTPDDVVSAVCARLNELRQRSERVDRLTLTGHGEPTLHPEFEPVVERLCEVRDESYPDVSLAILSNSTTADWPNVRAGLERLDERYMKLDAGSDAMLLRLNGDDRTASERLESLRGLRDIVIEAMFVEDPDGEMDNTLEDAVSEWIGALEQLQPSGVHIGTMGAIPLVNRVRPASMSALVAIASRVRDAGFPAEVFAAAPATGYPYSYADRQTGDTGNPADNGHTVA